MYKQYSSRLSGGNEDERIVDYWSHLWADNSVEQSINNLEGSEIWQIFGKHVVTDEPIIEAGCGRGQWVALLHKKGCNAVGVDIVEQPLKIAMQIHPELKLQHADVRKLPFDDSAFGVYMSLGVIEHFENGPEPVLDEARRVLRPGGILAISVPQHTPVTQLAARMRQKREGSEHFYQYLYTRRELRTLLESNGFTVIEQQSFGSTTTVRNMYPELYAKTEKSWRTSRGLDMAMVIASKVVIRVLPRVLSRGLLGHSQAIIARLNET